MGTREARRWTRNGIREKKSRRTAAATAAAAALPCGVRATAAASAVPSPNKLIRYIARKIYP